MVLVGAFVKSTSRYISWKLELKRVHLEHVKGILKTKLSTQKRASPA